MAKHDLYHEEVKAALVKDGWTITHDPLTIPGIGLSAFHIDLGAEKLIGAEKDGEEIAVEIKSFVGSSFSNDFHNALGQFINYIIALRIKEPSRQLFMAVSKSIFDEYFYTKHLQIVIEDYNLKVIVFNPKTKMIEQWIK